MTIIPSLDRDELLVLAESANRELGWPARSWAVLARSGVLGWSVPTQYGGKGLSALEQLQGNESLASACLTTAFLLSQREAAVRLIIKGPESLRERYLASAARGESYLTIGVSQLTTSRQHCAPAVQARPLAAGYRITGTIPWVTGAIGAQAVVGGATLEDGEQILFVLPLPASGVSLGAPLPLSALAGSCTSEIRCQEVFIPETDLLAGPGNQVLGKVGGGGLETSCLALGLADAAIEYLKSESLNRPEVASAFAHFEQSRGKLRETLHEMAREAPAAEDALKLRASCTRLALHATQAALLLSKGTGFVAPHPVQRWANQALFFLVWSCPRPVAGEVLEGLLSLV